MNSTRTYRELSLNAQNAYADLFSAASAISISRSVAGLSGSFSKKRVSGKDYWYFQYRDLDQAVRQIYVGPKTAKIDELIHQAVSGQEVNDNLKLLAKGAQALGCEPMLGAHFKVVKKLGEYGFFACGGMLVGTHAFKAIENMLGIAFGERMQTQDVDFAHAGSDISIAMPSSIQINAADAIQSLEMGLIPMGAFQGQQSARYIDPKNASFSIDFLTSQKSVRSEPVYFEKLGIALQPLKFLEFLMAAPCQAVVFCNLGAVVVNIPDPARFAVHKLIVAAERPRQETVKSNKDIRQAASLIEYFVDRDEDGLIEAFADARSRGPGWQKRLNTGLVMLSSTNKNAFESINKIEASIKEAKDRRQRSGPGRQ